MFSDTMIVPLFLCTVIIDTNRWFHQTDIQEGQMSVTIGSEYDWSLMDMKDMTINKPYTNPRAKGQITTIFFWLNFWKQFKQFRSNDPSAINSMCCKPVIEALLPCNFIAVCSYTLIHSRICIKWPPLENGFVATF